MRMNVPIAALVCLFGLATTARPQELQPGNWDIYLEPTAKLQTGTQVPFQITVQDALHKPLIDAKVTLQIETADHQKTQVFKAPAVDQGVYLAKPLFSSSGQWSVLVEVRRDNKEGARTIEYNVPK